MRKILLIFALALLVSACHNGKEQNVPEAVPMQMASADGISVPVYDFDGLKPMLDISDDTLRIFNFWATWCVPCVKELPYFEKVNTEYASQNVKVILISLDFIEDLETALIPFMKKHGLGSEVVLLDDPDANRWIPMVDPDWDGAIPVTLFRQGGQSSFIAHAVTYEELSNEINNYLKR
ncbi:MAG: TlpA disulfide reductase family protein [Bacteroidales bacterium]|jgi:thiol-disulfide isomerase/thioredoxin|nr:TlpA disulfide reductase family protein [Bacteroidales bacterium]